jgi:hypothetical protein
MNAYRLRAVITVLSIGVVVAVAGYTLSNFISGWLGWAFMPVALCIGFVIGKWTSDHLL